MKTQEELLQKVLDLKKANPKAEIQMCVCSDDIRGSFRWPFHTRDFVELIPWYKYGYHVITGERDIKEFLEKYVVIGSTKKDKRAKVEAIYQDEVEQAICVFTVAD